MRNNFSLSHCTCCPWGPYCRQWGCCLDYDWNFCCYKHFCLPELYVNFLYIPEKANFASSPSMTPSKTILSSVILKPIINYGKINKKIKIKSFWPASKKYICSTAPILNATAELPISRLNNSTDSSSNNTSITWVISFPNKLILKESPSYFSTSNSKSLKIRLKQPEKSRL